MRPAVELMTTIVPRPDSINAGNRAFAVRTAPTTFTSNVLLQLSMSASSTEVPSKAPPAFATTTVTSLPFKCVASELTLS